MSEEELRPARSVRAGVLKDAEEILHPADVPIDLGDRPHGTRVGFFFLVAAELQEREARRGSDHSVRHAASGRHPDRRQHQRQRNAASKARSGMAVLDVRYLVRDHRGERVLVRHALDQSLVDHDVPAEGREGIEHGTLVVVDRYRHIAGQIHRGDQAVGNRPELPLARKRVLARRGFALLEEGVRELPLEAEGDHRSDPGHAERNDGDEHGADRNDAAEEDGDLEERMSVARLDLLRLGRIFVASAHFFGSISAVP